MKTKFDKNKKPVKAGGKEGEVKSRPESPASVKITGWFYVAVSGMMFIRDCEN